MNPETHCNETEALEREAKVIEHEAAVIEAEAERLEHLAGEMKHRAAELEKEAERLGHRGHCPPVPIPAPRPVHPPRVHGWMSYVRWAQ